jgi:hypothetical protein
MGWKEKVMDSLLCLEHKKARLPWQQLGTFQEEQSLTMHKGS